MSIENNQPTACNVMGAGSGTAPLHMLENINQKVLNLFDRVSDCINTLISLSTPIQIAAPSPEIGPADSPTPSGLKEKTNYNLEMLSNNITQLETEIQILQEILNTP